jgi:molybdopterin-guanine dinucleotide biosynthesis protein B
MPKFVAVVGGKHSGKTTIIQSLISELKNRGYRVGTIKEMVRIPTLDTPATETNRYRDAGAELVVAIPRTETVIFVKKPLRLNEVLPFLSGLDIVLLEGFETERTLPKIIAAKNAEEVMEYSNGLAIAISGLIMDSKEELKKTSALQIPMFNALADATKLADIVELKAFAKLPDLPHCGECGYESCYEMAKAIVKGEAAAKNCFLLSKGEVRLEINGCRIPLKEFPEKIIRRMLEGMVSSLDGVQDVKELKIELRNE